MPKSSINFAKVSSHSFLHNDRSEKRTAHSVHSNFSHLNEFDFDAKSAKSNFDNLYKTAISKVTGKIRKAAKKNTLWEAVVNIKPNTKIEDLKELQQHIEKEFGFTGLQIAVHKDEGHMHENSKGELVQNLHAHMSFFTLDLQTGKQMMRRELVTKDKLRELQTKTAEILNMDRGVDKRVSGKERLEHKAYKKHIQTIEKYEYSFREMQKQITALEELDSEQKKELHRLNTEANKIKDDDTAKALKIEELEKKIKIAQNTLQTIKPSAKSTNEIKAYVRELEDIASNQSETAQKLTNAEKTINTLIEKNKELEMGLKINQEDFSLLLRQNKELEKKLQVQESNKKTLLKKYEAPLNANFWAFVQEKFTEFTHQIKELTQKIKELTEKIFNVEEKNQQLLKENESLRRKNLGKEEDLPVARDIFEVLGDIEEMDKKAQTQVQHLDYN